MMYILKYKHFRFKLDGSPQHDVVDVRVDLESGDVTVMYGCSARGIEDTILFYKELSDKLSELKLKENL